MQFNTLSNTVYEQERNQLVRELENIFLLNGNLTFLAAYTDPAFSSNPTSIAIGYGYDLFVHSVADINTAFAAMGGTITATGHSLIASAKANINLLQDPAFKASLQNEIFLPSLPSAEDLQVLVTDTEFEVAISKINLPESTERIAIISYMYQFGAAGIPTTLDIITLLSHKLESKKA